MWQQQLRSELFVSEAGGHAPSLRQIVHDPRRRFILRRRWAFTPPLGEVNFPTRNQTERLPEQKSRSKDECNAYGKEI